MRFNGHEQTNRTGFTTALVVALVVGFTNCHERVKEIEAGDSTTSSHARATAVALTGAGATFPYPLYARWFNEYPNRTAVRINYHSVGSGRGIEQFIAREVDFGATDMPLTDAQLRAAGNDVLHIPTVLGAVGITYNVPGVVKPLRLTGEVIADIFLGQVPRWNDSRIATLNPGVTLPALPISVVHRGDQSGTSYILSQYLSATSAHWATWSRTARRGWPTGAAENGNEGVAGRVKQTVGSIGYLEVIYARQNHLPIAHVRNRAGRFRAPFAFEIASAAASTLASVDSAASSTDLRVSLVDAPDENAYPITSFTWLVVAPRSLGPERSRQLADFLEWAMNDGSDIAGSLGYVALPSETAERVLGVLRATLLPSDDDRTDGSQQKRRRSR